MASESQLPYRQVNICASLEMTTKWIPAHKPPILPNLPTIYNLFMQNKANLRKSQVNVNLYNTTDYEEKSGKDLWKNEPNFGKAQMNVNLYNTTVYEEKCGQGL